MRRERGERGERGARGRERGEIEGREKERERERERERNVFIGNSTFGNICARKHYPCMHQRHRRCTFLTCPTAVPVAMANLLGTIQPRQVTIS